MSLLFLISRFLDGGIDTVLVEYLNGLCRYTSHDVTLAIGMKMNEAEVFLPRISPKVKIEYLVDSDMLTAYTAFAPSSTPVQMLRTLSGSHSA